MLGQRAAGWDSLNAGRTETHHCRCGVWSAQEGLALYPDNRAREQSRVEDIARRLIGALAETPDPGVVELSDACECWPLDAASRQPLALLGAEASAEEIPQRSGSRWRAAPGDDGSLAGFGRERAAALERLVAQRGGGLTWFEGTADGCGQEIGAGATAILPRDAFPELLLDEIWPATDRSGIRLCGLAGPAPADAATDGGDAGATGAGSGATRLHPVASVGPPGWVYCQCLFKLNFVRRHKNPRASKFHNRFQISRHGSMGSTGVDT